MIHLTQFILHALCNPIFEVQTKTLVTWFFTAKLLFKFIVKILRNFERYGIVTCSGGFYVPTDKANID